MTPARAVVAAKVNLALLVGPRRVDGLHDVATLLQRVDLCDRIELRPGRGIAVDGFPEDTLVTRALELLAAEAGVEPCWRARLEKGIPAAAGLGGGSADAAAALRLGNGLLPEPIPDERLHELAASLGADVPFFLAPGPKLAEGAGERLSPAELPQDYWVVIALPAGVRKPSTADVYRRFDELDGGSGFEERRAELVRRLAQLRRREDLALLPGNDLATASGAAGPAGELRAAGAFRADVSGAGPAVYGLFESRREAVGGARALGRRARSWVVAPVW